MPTKPADHKRILYCAIGEGKHRAALRETCNFAAKIDAQVDILAIVESASRWDRLAHGEYVEQIQSTELAELQRAAKQWARGLPEIGETTVAVGSIADIALASIDDSGADLVVVAAPQNRLDTQKTQRLMRLSPCSVWVVRPTRASRRRVMAAVNAEQDEVDLNLAIMNEAATFANGLDAELHVFSAWELYGQDTLRRSAFMHTSDDEFDDLYSRREMAAAHAVHELAEQVENPAGWTETIANGMAAPSIAEAVSKYRINLLVMGTVGRSGLSGLLMGNTAEEVLETLPCSLLSVRTPPSQ